MKLQSKEITIHAASSHVYQMLTDCNNIGRYIPADKVQNFRATSTECSFNLPGAGDVRFTISRQVPYSIVEYAIATAMKMEAHAVFELIGIDAQSCCLSAQIHAEVPFFMVAMLKPPLQKMVDMIVEAIKIHAEKEG